ncbi:MAG: peptidylprolyl isomerase [Nitrospirae bacterium]|nr:peptidylprolyl isomerase [Nitrospirota bacterium]
MERLVKKIIVPVLLVFFAAPSYSAILLDRVVATVNKEVITWSEFKKAIDPAAKEALKGLDDREKEKALKVLEKNSLNELINMRLQVQEAQRLGIDMKSSDVEDAITEIKKKYNLSSDDFIKSLKDEGFTLEEYRTKLKEQILISRLVGQEVQAKVLITDEEIKEYYEANKEKYKAEKVRLKQIFFMSPTKDEDRAALENKAMEIVQRLKAGEDFSNLAREVSEDASKKFGGDLGFVKRGDVRKEVEDMAFALKAGEVSKPFWSSKGLHIIKVEERVEGIALEHVKEEIKGILFENAFRLKYSDWIKGLREKAYIEINLNS